MGSSGIGSQSLVNTMIGIKSTDNTKSRIPAVKKSTSSKRKPLNYNHREISGQILRAKKIQSAGTVLTRAKSKVAVLQRQAGSGEYNSREVANALAHARRMVRCAQVKISNLKQEEQERKNHMRKSKAKEIQISNKARQKLAKKENDFKQKIALEGIQEISKEKRKRIELVQKRRMHRNQERSLITEADMKYLKSMTKDSPDDSPATLDLSMEALSMAELQMMSQNQVNAKIESEIEAEVEAEISAETGIDYTVGNGTIASMPVSDAAISTSDAAVGASVDISL